MKVTEVGFKIKIPLAKETTETKKTLDGWRKGLSELEKKELPRLSKTTAEYLKTTKRGFDDLKKSSEDTGRSFSKSMEDGLRSINKFATGLGKIKDKVFNLKTAIAGTVVGGAAFMAGRKIYTEGKQQLATRNRLKREFGDDRDFYGALTGAAGKLSRRAGIQDDEAARALIPLAESLQSIEAGASFRGMKGKLSAAQAAALRKKNLNFGSELIGRLSLMAPEMSADEIGRVAADALTGPEGIRTLISSFNLSKRSKKLASLNEQGKAFEALSPSERAQLGVTKSGQYLEQGDLVRLIMERSGMTMAAAEGKRGNLDNQLRDIGSQINDVFGDIGATALEKFNQKLKGGGTLADKLREYLKKNEGTIEKFGEGLAKGAAAVADLAMQLPKVGSFLVEHKTALLALGSAFVGVKVLSGLGGALGAAKDTAAKLGLGDGMRVFVTNMPGGGFGGGVPGAAGGRLSKLQKAGATVAGTLAALSAGYAIGSAADELTGGGISDAFADAANPFAKADRRLQTENGARAFHKKLEGAAAARLGLVAALESQGMEHGQAVFQAGQVFNTGGYGNQPQVIQLVVDGKKLAEVNAERQARDLNNRTAGGAARVYGE